jgi:GMP synthase (glutamine-hydrolysing)
MAIPAQKVLVIDFGSQVTHLICRRIREHKVYSELQACTTTLEAIQAYGPTGVILSGGPSSVYEDGAPHVPAGFWDYVKGQRIPVLGICYGTQEIVQALGGKVEPGEKREFGHAEMDLLGGSKVLDGLGEPPAKRMKVWMSHGDKVTALPSGFKAVGATENCEYAAVESEDGLFVGVQFHPEVTHTPQGSALIGTFVKDRCGITPTWSMESFLEAELQKIRDTVGDAEVIGAVSGGVDSTVCAALMQRAIGAKFHPFMVDSGLLRYDEANEVKTRLESEIPGMTLTVLDASDKFFGELAGVKEPEQKRKIIGKLFIDCFEAAVKQLGIPEDSFLLQGTLYPDVIESVSFKGPATTIKTHHNVGGLPARMKLRLVEPLRLLFKDEVRLLGRARDPHPRPRDAGDRRGPAGGGQDLHRRTPRLRGVRQDRAGLRGADAHGEDCRGHGGPPHLRVGLLPPR